MRKKKRRRIDIEKTRIKRQQKISSTSNEIFDEAIHKISSLLEKEE